MLALVIPDMLCGLQGVFAVDAEIFPRGGQPVSALMIVLFCILLLFFRQLGEVGEACFFLRASLERSLLNHMVYVWKQTLQGHHRVGCRGEKEEVLLDFAGSLHSFCDLPVTSVSDPWGGCHLRFPKNLELEVLGMEALGRHVSSYEV